MSNDELNSRMDKQDAILLEIKTALVGDSFGNPGLVRRVMAVESKQSENERTMLKWAGVATGASLVLGYVKSKILDGS